ncbi:MAG: ice-binding family protein [Minisyncoccota bacterium]
MKKFRKIGSVTTALAVSFGLSLAGPLVALAAGPALVNLGTAGNFVILAKTGISTTGSTAIVGDLGVSPAAATYLTGFALTLPSASAFSTSASVTGKVYAPGYANPTPANLTTAVLDMQTAYTDAAGRAPTVTELGAGNIGGLTLAPGVYKWSTGVIVPTNITLSGGANDVWIFQIAQNLNVSSGVHITLSGGAQAANIFWQVAGQTTIGTTAVFNGNILDQTAIVLNTGAQLNGRALAQTAVTLDANAVIIPSAVVTTTIPTTTPTSTSGSSSSSSNNTSGSNSSSATGSGSTVPTTTTTAQTMPGMQITLGNGQVVTVNALGDFTSVSGASISNSSVADATATVPPASAFGQQVRMITVNLGKGSKSNGVAILQQFLISQNKGPSAEALARVGPTSYFGVLTNAALAEFQANVGISPALGNFGPITRAYLSMHY